MSKPPRREPPAAPAVPALRLADEPTPTAEPPYALGILAERVGPADPTLLTQVLAGAPTANLVALGATISTRRIVTDATRLYGLIHDYWQRATPEKRRRVRGFSLPLLAVAVDQAYRLEQMMDRQRTKRAADGTTRAVLDATLKAARDTGLGLRDQAASALLDAAGQDPVLREELTSSVGRADPPDALALGLANLAKLLRRWLGLGDAALATRLALANLDEGYASELDQAGQQLLAAATAARLRPTPVTQGELDLLEGINLMLLGQIVRAFRHAHQLDPTIPRPIPIATRRFFSRRSPQKPASPKTAPAPSPSAAPAASTAPAAPAAPAAAAAPATSPAAVAAPATSPASAPVPIMAAAPATPATSVDAASRDSGVPLAGPRSATPQASTAATDP
ncbi:MAG TPA: hypothetical protein VH877_01325 [Polyangia bacterium]|nr:hypothetical protein [Polyangia bacterium]